MTLTHEPLTMTALNAASTRTRTARAKVRQDLQTGHVTLAEVLADPPECVQHIAVLDLIRMVRRTRSMTGGDQCLGAQAVRDRVNLLVPVGQASQRTRAWAARHAKAPRRTT